MPTLVHTTTAARRSGEAGDIVNANPRAQNLLAQDLLAQDLLAQNLLAQYLLTKTPE